MLGAPYDVGSQAWCWNHQAWPNQRQDVTMPPANRTYTRIPASVVAGLSPAIPVDKGPLVCGLATEGGHRLATRVIVLESLLSQDEQAMVQRGPTIGVRAVRATDPLAYAWS